MLIQIERLRMLYAPPANAKFAEHLKTLAPMSEEVRSLAHEHADLLDRFQDAACAAVTLDTRRIERYLRPDLLPLVARIAEAARALATPGRPDGALDGVRAAERSAVSASDREFEAAVEIARRDVDLLRGSVRGLRAHAAVLVDALAKLGAVDVLSSGAVTVPKVEFGYLSDGAAS